MHPPLTAPRSTSGKRVTLKHSALRAKRILARMNEGRSLQAIADEEGITRKRMRVLVKQALRDRMDHPATLHAEAQIKRLMPAFALAQRQIDEGEIMGIYALAALQKRLDIYQAVAHVTDAPTNNDQVRSAIAKVEHFIRTAKPYQPDPREAEGGADTPLPPSIFGSSL